VRGRCREDQGCRRRRHRFGHRSSRGGLIVDIGLRGFLPPGLAHFVVPYP
jgi:hypothetical protein